MKKFTYVEEYLEIIAGYRDVYTGNRDTSVFFFSPIINLARYDTGVIDSMTQATQANQALTERQGELAVKLIKTYKRQLANKYVDIAPIEEAPAFRVPCRKMDYSRRLELRGDRLYVKFPYNTQLIERFRSFKKESHGHCEFDQTTKEWSLALTEHNLNWVYAFAAADGFNIDQTVLELVNKIIEIEKTPYKIELYCNEGVLDISNCPDGMRAYINEHAGGFGAENLERLVDMSGEMGYTVEPTLLKIVAQQVNPVFERVAPRKEIKVKNMTDEKFIELMDYALAVGRRPVVIYEPNSTNKFLNLLASRYNDKHIQVIASTDKLTESCIDPAADFVHTAKPLRYEQYIPLLVSTAGMVFGSDRQLMLQASGKIIYPTSFVYKNVGSDPHPIEEIEI